MAMVMTMATSTAMATMAGLGATRCFGGVAEAEAVGVRPARRARHVCIRAVPSGSAVFPRWMRATLPRGGVRTRLVSVRRSESGKRLVARDSAAP